MKIIGRLFVFLILTVLLFTLIFVTSTSDWISELFEDEDKDEHCVNLPPHNYVHPVFLASGPPIQKEPRPSYHPNRTEKSAELHCDFKNKTVIIVHSHVNHTKLRAYQRSTFTRKWLDRNNAIMYFVVASEDSSNIDDEMEKFGDVLQVDAVENYHNITYKAIYWIRELAKCEHGPKIIVKIDDDVHTDLIGLQFLMKRYYTLDDFIACRVLPNGQVVRNPASKWYLSKDEYKFNNLGTYCQGMAYLISGNLLPIIHGNIEKSQILWMDDWYVTRSLIRDYKISYYSLDQHIMSPNSESELKDGLKNVRKQRYRTIFAHFRPPQKFPMYRRTRVWANITDVNNSCDILKAWRKKNVVTY
ncbi:unnamed protein product [Caenorhabditis sp. 36 PRJEB53466]|nr:unnamed protein product [Caenorhabditis sp. 36 PRJEB53466]